jgi:alpha-tubulin suppressor-like RCC1 family protein
MSGFNSSADGDFDRVFMTSTDFIDQFVGEQLWGVGSNSSGELGDGTTSNRSIPVITAGGGINWKQVSCGYQHHTAAIKTDGTLWTCGYNGYGQLGDGTATDRSSPGTTAGGGTNWKQVAAGSGHIAAIKTDGTLWSWGANNNGQSGDGTTSNRSSPVTVSGGGTNWKQVSAGSAHTGAIKTDGTLWTWGYNGYGQLGDGTTSNRSSPITTAGGGTNWKQVSCARNTTTAIKTDGTLWACGYNQFYGQLGDGTATDRSSPATTAGGGTNWKQVAAGGRHTAAIKSDGTLWTWGYNGSGQLGNGITDTGRRSPGTTVGIATNWKQVACGAFNTAAIGN